MAMNLSRAPLANGRCLTLVGSMLCVAAMAGGCDSNAPSSPAATAPGQSAPPAASPAAGNQDKGNLDTSSRRQHQKQQPGGAPQAK
jgi:hypothetical protein